MTALASSQPPHTFSGTMFPWDNCGGGHLIDNTFLKTQALVFVARGLHTNNTTKFSLPATQRVRKDVLVYPGVLMVGYHIRAKA
ncbi:hypothetical protein PoB_002410200 [Plakobranchus ocellatus]|uniref:Uncharacterized protein n=1 Tax=Plakobranchus ocellatus TaxID=259542 RepID=A0AAV3ZSS4_9GAST|nr:hypothetical protein PoB_002410200 [Plakobranchus ocellatus]